MPRSFNTTGPCAQGDHCMLDPLARLDVDEVLRLIGEKRYVVLHAPRQTGKTTSLMALMNRLNEEGRYRAVIELKLLKKAPEAAERLGLAQTAGDARQVSADDAHQVLFDRRPEVPWDARILQREAVEQGLAVSVWRA